MQKKADHRKCKLRCREIVIIIKNLAPVEQPKLLKFTNSLSFLFLLSHFMRKGRESGLAYVQLGNEIGGLICSDR